MINIGLLKIRIIVAPLFPSFLHHHCLQILYTTNFLRENVFYILSSYDLCHIILPLTIHTMQLSSTLIVFFKGGRGSPFLTLPFLFHFMECWLHPLFSKKEVGRVREGLATVGRVRKGLATVGRVRKGLATVGRVRKGLAARTKIIT